mgnify:CR=1 FL=1
MEYSSLYQLITCLEYGTRVHINVVFLGNTGNYKTKLPAEKVTHSKPFCEFMKSTPKGFERCFACKNFALHKAITGRKPFGGFCFNGIYEYCCPVIEKGNVTAVIFIGNILADPLKISPAQMERFSQTFERNFPEEMCVQFGCILENQIKLLIEEYADRKTEFDPLITNIKNFIEESLYHDISVRHIASVFNYDEKYIGRVFKRHTGKTIKEYMNIKRLKKAEELLKNTKLSITEVSGKAGFNNVTYFNRIFKRYLHVSPMEYRNAQP